MPVVGDRVRVRSRKIGQVVREGVVTQVLGHLLRVKWSTGGETTFTPGPGSLTVVGRNKVRPSKKAPNKKAAASTKKRATVGSEKPTKKVGAMKSAAPRKAR
jgi:hypothetical protein